MLEQLLDQGLQSDARFAEQYVASRRRKGYGPTRIRAELRERGIADQLVAACLDEQSEEWKALMRQVAEKKFGGDPAADRRDLARRGRFLAARGFPSWLISDYLFGGE